MIAGRLANRKRKGYGTLNTHWRTGWSGKNLIHQMLGMTGVAAYPQKTVLETTAFEIVLELPPDITRQRRTLCRKVGQENGVVCFDKLVKEGSLPTCCQHDGELKKQPTTAAMCSRDLR